mgnify:CR=1 FL=1
MQTARERIYAALDVSSLEQAQTLVEELAPFVGCFKVGLQLLTSVGAPMVVRLVHSLGGKVGYDGKLDDIPNTVGETAKIIADFGVLWFNVHASAGRKSVEAAIANRGKSQVFGVTVLTSIDEEECISIFGDKPGPKALLFSRMLAEAGADGIICSPKELAFLNEHEELACLTKVTPGVRPEWASTDDQKRVMTPGEAIAAGATNLVIGRPITKPPSEIGPPVEAAKRIADEIEAALNARQAT